jgi:uncharacterized Ntn-hydrolase superfamily protein
MTFSIVGRCGRTGQFGMAIASSSPAVAARCLHMRPGVGAAASQNVTDPALGPLILEAMAGGADAAQALAGVAAGRAHIGFRQLLAIGAAGPGAIRSGEAMLGVWSEAPGEDCAAAGNLLAGEGVPAAMVAAFAAAPQESLGERLMAALEAGLAGGGEAGPVRSAGLGVVGDLSWRIVDLRIDWAEAPVAMLRAAWDVYCPQIDDYIWRARDPSRAPSYGVPGNE